ncbi:hypothetical protein BDQ94DRAFT_74295 [Aspergillus welwitschiae]|uniref:Uncharacterized protein n=1 Tax=Aspergillus welwitschiae TaxID=1341132 RepID=A0A3F3QGJ4_9EURO|nr:hypothetical protein BDQ94DRAFT_74295 [Aspergillus welwitschiae]RDH38190.1 hypothetical protein BDQ94DRAFT_74295 [Aspergillus welwitschiae]
MRICDETWLVFECSGEINPRFIVLFVTALLLVRIKRFVWTLPMSCILKHIISIKNTSIGTTSLCFMPGSIYKSAIAISNYYPLCPTVINHS